MMITESTIRNVLIERKIRVEFVNRFTSKINRTCNEIMPKNKFNETFAIAQIQPAHNIY